MNIGLLGASGSGKSLIEKELVSRHGFKKIIPYTTRKPRSGEVNGKDYYFISKPEFNDMVKLNLFAEYDEYTQGRKYGTLISDYVDDNRVVVLTPNGLRQVKNNIRKEEIFSVFVRASLGTRIKRYIDRVGVNNFSYEDKNEIAARVERDFGMFLGVEKEVDLIVQNEENTNIEYIVSDILNG